MVGAPDALHQAGGALRRADIDDEVDVAPVDAEVERRGADHGPELPGRHGRPRPCGAGRHRASRGAARWRGRPRCACHSSWKTNSACMRVLTKTSVVRCAPDEVVDLRHGVAGGVARPRAGAARSPGCSRSRRSRRPRPPRRRRAPGRPAPAATSQRRSSSGSRTVADRPTACRLGASVRRRARPSARRSPRFEVTTAWISSRTTRLSDAEQRLRLAARQQQRELLGRRQEDVGRIGLLALALAGRRVAGAGLDADRQPHLGDRRARGCARRRPPAP